MKLTTQSEYSLLALLYIARKNQEGFIKLSGICKELNLPIKYMERLMHMMCNEGFLISAKGVNGGYKLAKSPEKIVLVDVFRRLDGPLAPVQSVSRHFYKPTVSEREAKLTKLMIEIRDLIVNKLEQTSLKDIM